MEKQEVKKPAQKIVITYMFKQKTNRFDVKEENDLFNYFQENCHLILSNHPIGKYKFEELDDRIKALAQEDLETQTDYNHDGHPREIIVYRGESPVYFIAEYFSAEEIQEIISKILKEYRVDDKANEEDETNEADVAKEDDEAKEEHENEENV